MTDAQAEGSPSGDPFVYDLEDECIEWHGYRDKDGYGTVYVGNYKTVRAHRHVYEECIGPIPNGLILRHKCDNPPCVNPNHLEPGTQKDNARDRDERGRLKTRWTGEETYCQRGHEFGYNPKLQPGRNRKTARVCRQCHNERNRAYYQRQKAKHA
jgi:hypothetical protein